MKPVAKIRGLLAALLTVLTCAGCSTTSPARYRIPAPAEDSGHQFIREAVFGPCAGLDDTDKTMHVEQWSAKRIWHILGLEYNLEEYKGPPAMRPVREDGWVIVEGTVTDGGVPCRNQWIAAEIEQLDEPILITLRSTDAFGEVLIELDLKKGFIRTRSVTVSRTMIGGQSHSSPMPVQSSNRIVFEGTFTPPTSDIVDLELITIGDAIIVNANKNRIAVFCDPDPAGGKFGFGSTGRMRFRNVNQWELIAPYEQDRREACIKEMHEFAVDLDKLYDGDVIARNKIETIPNGILWTYLRTGATARFTIDGPYIRGTIGAGLYGNDTLVEGRFPEIEVVDNDGQLYTADFQRIATVDADQRAIRMTLPLRSEQGKTATANVLIDQTVQTVWWWTVTVDGVDTQTIRMYTPLADRFKMTVEDLDKAPDAMFGVKPEKGKAILKQNGKAGIYTKAIIPGNTVLGTRPGSNGELGISTTDAQLRLATSILPAQPLNPVALKHRMVHYIRYPEGPVQHWRRAPSYQEYPSNVDLARFAGHGADAMVWHHTWLNSDFRDREGFFVNHEEMKRAMDETHRLGMKAIGYLGIVPGRSSLLRFEDTCPLGGKNAYGGYGKNWDLQDQTFYHLCGRYPEYIAWMTDYWCKEYGLDGFYLDGGAFGQASRGGTDGPMYPEDADMTLDELQHRAYWRVKKVLTLNNAPYGLEPWSGLNWLINGFYDCMMIGESFQEADPSYYRDGHNALLTGCMVKMYGMRESSQNPYNIAMAAVNLSDIQICSGNGAWGDEPDDDDAWKRVRPLWDILDSIDWDHLIDARPWYAQELVSGDGVYAGNYTLPKRVIVFLANKSKEAGKFDVMIDPAKLPKINGQWKMRYCLNRAGDLGTIGDGRLTIELPSLDDGPIGIELLASE